MASNAHFAPRGGPFVINESNSIRLQTQNSPANSPSDSNDVDSVYSARKTTEEEESRWRQFKYYSLWNSIRFLVMASLICYANFHNQKQIEGYQKYCCDCYYVAKNQSHFGINGYRIDWSYCMPQCVDCHYCEKYYHGNATAAFNHQESCPASNYTDTSGSFSWHWKKSSGCPSEISITTLKYFLKDYRVYGVASVVIAILYTMLMASFVFCCKQYTGVSSGASLLVYNVIVSILSVYGMFKPFQYYHQQIDNAHKSICEVDSISETVENIITYCVYSSFIFVFTQWIMGVVGCIMAKRVMKNTRSSQGSMSRFKLNDIYIKMEKLMIGIAALLASVFFIFLIYASAVMIQVRATNERINQDLWKIIFIILVDALSILSVVDIFLFPFCRTTVENFFGNSQRVTRKTYHQLYGRSIDETHENNNFVPLVAGDQKEEEE